MNIVETGLLTVINIAVLVTCGYALLDCLRRPAAGFIAHGKLTKQIWTGILVGALAIAVLLGFLSFIGSLAVVAAIVYLVDVKPALTGSGNW
ncbi:MAG: DUF2516 family protein [Mycobacteriales bacterium]